MKIQTTRAGFVHHYHLQDQGLAYSCDRTQMFFAYADLLTIRSNIKGELFLIPQHRKTKLCLWLSAQDAEPFLKELFQRWAKVDGYRAQKVAFDYSSNTRSIGIISMAMALCFPLALAVLFLADGFKTLNCNSKLIKEGVLQPAQIVKIKKNRRSDFIWQLEFKTQDGAAVHGTRTSLLHDEKGGPLQDVQVVYAPSDLSCWDLNKNSAQKDVNFVHRNFYMHFNLVFGIGFAVLGVLVFGYGLARYRFKPAYQAIIAKVFS